jgi:hypothetical protein
MTRIEFINEFKHELAGLMLEGAMEQRKAGDLGFWARTVMKRVDERLGQMYDAMLKNPPVPVNGVKK